MFLKVHYLQSISAFVHTIKLIFVFDDFVSYNHLFYIVLPVISITD